MREGYVLWSCAYGVNVRGKWGVYPGFWRGGEFAVLGVPRRWRDERWPASGEGTGGLIAYGFYELPNVPMQVAAGS